MLAAHAGVGWSSGSHTALPTLTTAQGVGADVLVGMTENTDIAIRLKKLISGRQSACGGPGLAIRGK